MTSNSSKKAVILHGTDAGSDKNWFPWLKAELESVGYKVWVPDLPNNHYPNAKVYNNFLHDSGWDFTDNLVIGHSSGAVSILNLLSDDRTPKIDTGILIGAWHTNSEPWTPPSQFVNLFPKEGFDFKTIKSKSNQLIYMHGDDDPYCPLEQAKWLANQTKSKLIIVPKGHHLGSRFSKLPELAKVLSNINKL